MTKKRQEAEDDIRKEEKEIERIKLLMDSEVSVTQPLADHAITRLKDAKLHKPDHKLKLNSVFGKELHKPDHKLKLNAVFGKEHALVRNINQPLADQMVDAITRLQDAKSRKAYYKLKVNSVFGKTMQANEKFHDSALVRNINQFHKATYGKVLIDCNILGSNLTEVQTRRKKIKITSPRYLGAAIMSNSKVLMNDFVYNCLWSTFTPETAQIGYTDTDSLYIKVNLKDVRQLSETLSKHSSVPTKQQNFERFMSCFSPEQKQMYFAKDEDITPGLMKLEALFDEAVFLGPKSYAFIDRSCGKETHHNKGCIMDQNKKAHV